MKVYLHILCAGVPDEKLDGTVETADGATVYDALTAYIDEQGLGVFQKRLENGVIMVNGKAVPLKFQLEPNQKVNIIVSSPGG